MTSSDIKKESEKEESCSVPAFGVSGQFMMTSEEKAVPSEDFNPRKIVALTLDDSLARLFECLTLEYSGSILLTPKWKNFRSQKLKFAEKTRINNAIWRSWHIQFKECKRPLFCQFDNPLTEMAKKPRPVTLMIEGKYWKQKLEAVAAQYQKWRVFYKQMVEDKFQDVELQHQTEEILRLDQEISDRLREREKQRKFSRANQMQSSGSNVTSPISLVVSQALEMVDTCNLMENMVFALPDTLFSSLANNQGLGRVRTGTFKDTADTVQPTLDTLQPSLEAMTPVLDELIEQLESSMKGSELNWDFDSLERSYDPSLGLPPPTSGADVEPMDHSGQYGTDYVTMGSIVTSSAVKTSWPIQSNAVPTHTMYTPSSLSHIEAQLPIWTSAPVLHPNVIGYQTVGMQGNVNLQGQNAGRVIPSMSTSLMDIAESNPVVTSRPYIPSVSIGKRLPAPPSACAVEASAGRLPRNSSDSQLYLLAAGDSQSRPRAPLPVELQAPNLVAQLKLAKPRQMLIEEKAKRLRLPRNRSAPGLASLDSTAQLRKTSQVGGVRAKRLGRIPRNCSDSALSSLLIRQSEQSTSTARRDSESSDSPPTMQVSSSQPAGGQGSIPHVFTRHQPAEVETTPHPPSQLVHDMVTHLMNKGISMEEILNRLTSMAAAGTVSQAQGISNQITSAASSMASILQEQRKQQQKTSLSKPPSYLSTPNPSTSTVTTPRSRRKAQTPRPTNVKAESPAVVERSGLRANNNTLQNLLTQNLLSNDSRVPNADSPAPAAAVGSKTRWENATTSMSLGKAAHTLAHMSEPLPLQNVVVSQYPLSLQGTSTLSAQSLATTLTAEPSSSLQHLRVGNTDTASTNTGYLPSMVMTSSVTSSNHSQAEASTSKTTVTENRDGFPTPYAESQTRAGPLTRTLPKEQYKEHRRMVHVSAEQKRRGHIKMGFDQLVEMVPSLAAQGSAKISKASVLKQSVDYIVQVQQEQEHMEREKEKLKREIEQLNFEISNCQQQLPETGVMVNKQDNMQMEMLFNRYVQDRTEQNPKFWIFSVLMRPLFNAYTATVSTASQDEFYATVVKWLEESCCLPKLRPSVLASLRELIKNTSILSDPSKFPEQARLAANALKPPTTAFDILPRCHESVSSREL